MDAAADYAAAKAMLNRPLPAYVSYTVRSHVKFDAFVTNKTSSLTVRTADGEVVKGDIPDIGPGSFNIGGQGTKGTEPAKHPVFQARCYEPTGAEMRRYQGAGSASWSNLEAISLHSLCTKKKGDQDFDTLYVDPRSHEPIAAVGTPGDQTVDVRIEQTYGRTADRVMPATLYVRIHGTGFMFWLDVLVDQRYYDYRFSMTPP